MATAHQKVSSRTFARNHIPNKMNREEQDLWISVDDGYKLILDMKKLVRLSNTCSLIANGLKEEEMVKMREVMIQVEDFVNLFVRLDKIHIRMKECKAYIQALVPVCAQALQDVVLHRENKTTEILLVHVTRCQKRIRYLLTLLENMTEEHPKELQIVDDSEWDNSNDIQVVCPVGVRRKTVNETIPSAQQKMRGIKYFSKKEMKRLFDAKPKASFRFLPAADKPALLEVKDDQYAIEDIGADIFFDYGLRKAIPDGLTEGALYFKPFFPDLS